MSIGPIATPSSFLEALWKAGQKSLAKQQEESSRKQAAVQGLKDYFNLFSCAAQDILDSYITVDSETIEMKRKVQILQGYDDPVLIQGPTGTGKELIARALHGSRSGKFVAVNCTSLPDELLESEMFGHVKGAFTGAVSDRVGKFRAAFNGTIFLDEIGDMPLGMQAKLLRVLQEKVVCPIGSDTDEPIKCRVVAATNKSLTDVHFREDVLHRLNVFELRTKGLEQRLCDIEEIVDSLGGEGLVNEFEKWKANKDTDPLFNAYLDNQNPYKLPRTATFGAPTVDYSLRPMYEKDPERFMYSWFFSLSGNVRSLQAQVRRYKVLGVLN